MNSPTPMRRQPPPQALSGRRGAAEQGHRRLHDAQHPAHREPERRGRADHRRPRARDRAGLDPRSGRRHRARRPHPRRPDPAPEGGQGLRAEAGRARARALLLAGQSDRSARAGAAAHGGARRRAAARRHAGARDLRALGRGRAAARLRQRGPARGGARALHQAPRRPAARRPGRRSTSRPSAACNSPRRSATASPTRCAWRRLWAASRSPFPAATAASPTTSSALRKPTTSPRSSSANRTRSSLVRASAWLGGARSRALLRQYQRARHRRRGPGQGDRSRGRPCAPPTRPAPFDASALSVRACSPWPSPLASALLLWPWIGTENTDLVYPHGRRRRRRALRSVAVARSPAPRRRFATISSSLPPYYTFAIADPTERHRRRVLRHRGRGGVQCRGARAHARRHRHGSGAHHRGALCLQPQAVRRRHARRRALGKRLPGSADAQGPGRPAAAREWHPCRQDGLSARGHSR